MNIGERIQKLGFKRWYERTLIETHAYLVTAFLGLALAFAGVELAGRHGAAVHLLLGVAAVGIGSGIVGFGVHRYLRVLALVENFGELATCRRCGTYAAFSVLASSDNHRRHPLDPSPLWLNVKCRKCGYQWRIAQ